MKERKEEVRECLERLISCFNHFDRDGDENLDDFDSGIQFNLISSINNEISNLQERIGCERT